MADLTPYIERHPGDMVTAEDWNQVQIDIKEDIGSQVQTTVDKAIAAIVRVPEAGEADKADDADMLAGKTLDDLIKLLVDKVIAQIPSKVGYMQIFKKLEVGEQNVVKHGLEAQPLVDIYQLEYFRVVSTEGAAEDDRYDMWVNFYLYHSSEKRIRFRPENNPAENIDIEPPDGPPYRIAFEEMLRLYDVQYTENTSLSDLENEFWKAFFNAPNDEFDDDQYTHSPWFDKCCREEESVRSVKRKGNWDDIWFQMRPRKTVNLLAEADADGNALISSPNQVEVVHFDLNTLALNLLADPVHPIDPLAPISGPERDISQEMKVMLVLKV